MTLKKISENKVFGGLHQQFTHLSNTVNGEMQFAVFLPPNASTSNKVPVLYWLSGLTCTDENFMQKAGAQRIASELGIAIVAPDTSPRSSNTEQDVADDPNYDLGKGAGFYLNATQLPWSTHFKMYDYVVSELPEIIEANFPVNAKKAISGHSMGGHGALTIGLKNPTQYSSISAFSPICNPMDCPWGVKAFTAYLGNEQSEWQQYDASYLMQSATDFLPTKVDQGGADNFLAEQLKPESLELAAKNSGFPLELSIHDGYDHSYYFISSFVEQHLAFHAKYLFD